jgi:SAM-dependent methyltransferase
LRERNQQSLSASYAKTANPIRGNRCVPHRHLKQFLVLHLQCHFGRETLTLAQRGATVVGLDFSAPAIAAAQALATELGVTDWTRFIEADLYDATRALSESFDLVFVNWGAINWLPDIRHFAGIVAHFLNPGGGLYLAEGLRAHTCSMTKSVCWTVCLATALPILWVNRIASTIHVTTRTIRRAWKTRRRTNGFIPLGEIVTSLLEVGLTLKWLHEHDSVLWRMFGQLVEDANGMYRWPKKSWFPLGFSLRAERSQG